MLFVCFYEAVWCLIKGIKLEKLQGRAEQISQAEDAALTGNAWRLRFSREFLAWMSVYGEVEEAL